MIKKILIGAACFFALVVVFGGLAIYKYVQVSDGLRAKYLALICESDVTTEAGVLKEALEKHGQAYFTADPGRSHAIKVMKRINDEMNAQGFTEHERQEVAAMGNVKSGIFATRALKEAMKLCPKKAGNPGLFLENTGMVFGFMQEIAQNSSAAVQ